jgi:aspartyl-tRNA(Asn)/glutamyl-tRNA(Gln) amidotransferase subunit C
VVTRDEILKIAKLARLSVEEGELDALTRDMASIIAFADQINAAADDAAGFDTQSKNTDALRPDEVAPSFDRELILSNVAGGEDGFFFIKKRA